MGQKEMQWIRTTWHFFHVEHHRNERKEEWNDLQFWTAIKRAISSVFFKRGGKFLIDIKEEGIREGVSAEDLPRRRPHSHQIPSHVCERSQNGLMIFFSLIYALFCKTLTFSPLHPWSFLSRLLRSS